MNEIDGVVIVGGGDFSFVAGLWALQAGAATIAVAHFGGAGRKVWRVLDTDTGFSSREEIAAMGERWQAGTATRLAEIAKRQSGPSRKRRALVHNSQGKQALWGGLLLLSALVACLLLPLLYPDSPPMYYLLLSIAPVLAGAFGAGLRYIWDANPAPRRTHGQALLLGAGAGLIYNIVFWINQASADVAMFETTPPLSTNRAMTLLLSTIAVGFGAGFAVDMVFRRLRDHSGDEIGTSTGEEHGQ